MNPTHSNTILLHFDFPNTHGNHAGMSYFARRIAQSAPGVREICQPLTYYKGGSLVQTAFAVWTAIQAIVSLRKGDNLFLMELGTPVARQALVAKICRIFGARFRILGLVHLAYPHLLEVHDSPESLANDLCVVDEILVFGSSLEKDLAIHHPQLKVRKTFHYVDADFYTPGAMEFEGAVRVIVMGALKRSFDTLPGIISACPSIEFHICCGRTDRSSQFAGIPNAVLHSFMEEAQLRDLMGQCHVSLSILEDTIGSNVIVTSLASGLVNVASEVGSIRDYCDESNSILVRDAEQFVTGLLSLDQNRSRLRQLRESARARALELSLPTSLEWFRNLLSSSRILP